MTDSPNVALRFSDEEKAALLELAARFHRSQSSILRVLVCEAVAVLREQDKKIETKNAIRPRAGVAPAEKEPEESDDPMDQLLNG